MRRFGFCFLWIWLVCGSGAAAQQFLIEATGTGRSVEEAQGDAVAQIASRILSTVEAASTSTIEVKNGAVTREEARVVQFAGAGLELKGLEFSPPTRAKGQYMLTAHFGGAALRETVEWLAARLPQLALDGLARAELARAGRDAARLEALLRTPGARNVVPQSAELLTRASALRAEVQKRSGQFGAVRFLSQQEALVLDLRLGGEPASLNEKFFLPAGVYNWQAQKSGYYPLKGRVRVSRQRTENVSLTLIRQLNAPLPVRVQSENTELGQLLSQDLLERLLAYDCVETEDASHRIVIETASSEFTPRPGWRTREIVITITGYAGSRRVAVAQDSKKLLIDLEDGVALARWRELADRVIDQMVGGEGLYRFAQAR